MSPVKRPPIVKPLVLIPTYNERDNLEAIIARINKSTPEAHVVVLDDNSPDGTGELADALAAKHEEIHVIHRPGKAGLGAAYLEGFAWGLDQGYDALIEMDADGSHRPEHLPAIIAAAANADVVIGSRWVPGGEVQNWPWQRKVLSRGGNTYTNLMLGLRVSDATGGYRLYRASALRAMALDLVESHGYCFQIDLTRRAHQSGQEIVEVPIVFPERVHGESKMNGSIVQEALWRTTKWGASYRLQQLKTLLGMQ